MCWKLKVLPEDLPIHIFKEQNNTSFLLARKLSANVYLEEYDHFNNRRERKLPFCLSHLVISLSQFGPSTSMNLITIVVTSDKILIKKCTVISYNIKFRELNAMAILKFLSMENQFMFKLEDKHIELLESSKS